MTVCGVPPPGQHKGDSARKPAPYPGAVGIRLYGDPNKPPPAVARYKWLLIVVAVVVVNETTAHIKPFALALLMAIAIALLVGLAALGWQRFAARR